MCVSVSECACVCVCVCVCKRERERGRVGHTNTRMNTAPSSLPPLVYSSNLLPHIHTHTHTHHLSRIGKAEKGETKMRRVEMKMSIEREGLRRVEKQSTERDEWRRESGES